MMKYYSQGTKSLQNSSFQYVFLIGENVICSKYLGFDDIMIMQFGLKVVKNSEIRTLTQEQMVEALSGYLFSCKVFFIIYNDAPIGNFSQKFGKYIKMALKPISDVLHALKYTLGEILFN